MPRAKKPKIDPDSLWICWMSGSAEVDGQNVSFHQGERLRGDSPAVQGCPQYFVPDGTPENERPNEFTQVVERANAERAVVEHDAIVVHMPTALERQDVRVLARSVAVLVGAGKDRELVRFEKGDCFRADSELCSVLPSAFEDPPEGVELVKPKRARR